MTPRIHRSLFRAIVLAASVLAGGCAGYTPWERDVTLHGISFDRVRYSSSGTVIGYMGTPQTVDGYSCDAGWIHLYEETWTLRGFTLAETTTIAGVDIPAGTWVQMDPDGVMTSCAFPQDTEIQGYTCLGTGGPTGAMTGFYPSGALRWFFSPEYSITIDGIPCRGGVFHIIGLHEDGALREADLAHAATVGGTEYPRGTHIVLDADGTVIEPAQR